MGKMTVKKKIDVYQVLLDVGRQIPGILVINPQKIDEKTYEYHKKNGEIYNQHHDVQLDFGIGKNNFRFAGLTDNYLDLYDLAVKMIGTSVDQTSKGLIVNGKQTEARKDLIWSVDHTNLYVPIGFPIPTGLSRMFVDPSTVHAIDFSLPQVGRLADIIKAGNYNLFNIDLFTKEKIDKEDKGDNHEKD